MAITPRLELRQTQTLVMTPQLQQAIRLLQLSNLELVDYVEAELEKNPLLEHDEGDRPEAAESDPGSSGDRVEVTADSDSLTGLQAGSGDTSDDSQPLDTDYDNLYSGDSASDQPANGEAGGGDYAFRESRGSAGAGGDYDPMAGLTEEKDLRQHLHDQLTVTFTEPKALLIGAHLIECLDDAGYLTESVDEVAERLGAPAAEVEATLATLQTFEPTGVFARNLSECLALQLRELNRLDPAMEAMLERLDMLAEGDLNGLMRHCQVDAEDLTEMVAELRRLNPKPGLQYGTEIAQTVIPDIFLRRGPGGDWIIELNSETLPRLLINERYLATVNGSTRDKAERAFVSDCLASANWLIKSLDQRANTILRVASEIVRQQTAFLDHGVAHLRPLNLRTIADAISMHESTVSRVTANKYIATPRGIFEMKYFFTTAIAAVDGEASHSAEAVRQKIRELIEEEPPKSILSDDKIVDLLKSDGVDIARRTVAKYREAMRIPSSVQRRRLKKRLA
ncbi:RNA polymerase factor sigma-54 [Oceanibacterium hippocampi]|uniref:RNA polymerase sigma-54 factor n=1 Tax=Oceanibacterium hippocampi TaxID=745714 RepID=A0A1Y5RS61_9PROT|nr:RNA polymerase factor sigma-54 [Oceanibacterium hippocampi]SLN23114.1 RNA polymerase sigma-54 factor 2 [Oceanibacterium hippocampi]